MDDIRYELVEIRTRSPVLFTAVAKAPALAMRGELYRPPEAVAPPWPAVVVSEGRGGIKLARLRPYACHLATHGHAVLVLDSYAGRGFACAATPRRHYHVTEAMMLADAFAGLAFLAARADIDAGRIHHLGFAHGGLIALLSAFDQLRATFAAGEAAFASHASFYGDQAIRLVDYRTRAAPAAIFYGGQDDTLNHARLDLLAGDLRAAGGTVTVTGYDAACHEWDREAERPRYERFNLRRLAGRIDPTGTLSDDVSGRPVTSARGRGLWLARATSLDAVQKARNEDVTERARADLLRHLTAHPRADAPTEGAAARPALRVIAGRSQAS